MEYLLLGVFGVCLLACVFTGASIVLAMAAGFVLFFGYGLWKGKTWKEMLGFSVQGIRTVRNVLITFLLIGILTAVWRSSGSIAFIVYHAASFCRPLVMVLVSFLLCSLISFLTGTAFGSAATIGVICMTMAASLGVPPLYTGGAVLAGVFFGDRCSPVSTSALLVSELTKTDLYSNISAMVKTALIPFLISCGLYWYLGLGAGDAASGMSSQQIFAEYYRLSFWTVLPVAAVLLLSLLRVNVKYTLAVSSLLGIAVSLLIQKASPAELFRLCILGFQPENAELAALMSGGGIISMVRVFCIVCISSCYSGMFQGTGFLDRMQEMISALGNRITAFGAILVTSVVSSAIGCNQTLAIMLTHQLCSGLEKEKDRMAISLENSAVVVAPLIPWSIAGAVPLDSVGAPLSSIALAFYLYLIPVWYLLMNRGGQKASPGKNK